MRKIILLLTCATLSLPGFASEMQDFITEARGVGTTADAALKDALSQAVQQAAGALVDSQTLIKNDEIMQERILTCSDGIVRVCSH